MRMTYRQLLQDLKNLDEFQLDCDVTVEGGEYGCLPGECHAADFRICDTEHDSLDEDHPVIFIFS